jgi:hypothetical protein
MPPSRSLHLISPEEGTEKDGRKTLPAKRLRSFDFGFALLDAFDTRYRQPLKILAIYFKISTFIEYNACQSVILRLFESVSTIVLNSSFC